MGQAMGGERTGETKWTCEIPRLPREGGLIPLSPHPRSPKGRGLSKMKLGWGGGGGG